MGLKNGSIRIVTQDKEAAYFVKPNSNKVYAQAVALELNVQLYKVFLTGFVWACAATFLLYYLS